MTASVSFPTSVQLDIFLASRRQLNLSYSEKMDTRTDFTEKRLSPLIKQYDYDENRVLLGEGEKVFEAGKMAIRQWKMFPEHWTNLYPDDTAIEVGKQVAVLFKIFGVWWWNSSEIVYTIDEPKQFGFAYGTLPGHVESGEELFLVEMDEAKKVWYTIKAFSRPAYWLVKLVYPFARSQQGRFVRASMQQMKAWVVKIYKILEILQIFTTLTSLRGRQYDGPNGIRTYFHCYRSIKFIEK